MHVMKNHLFDALASINPAWHENATHAVFPQDKMIVELSAWASPLVFPMDGIVSVHIEEPRLRTKRNGETVSEVAQVAMLGRWDVLGQATLNKPGPSPIRAQADMRVEAWVMPAAAGEILRGCAKSRDLLTRYGEHRAMRLAHRARLAMEGSVAMLIATWLLEAREGLGDDLLPFTHTFIHERLRVRRPSVGEALAEMAGKGLIKSPSNGRIDIIDREGLARFAGLSEEQTPERSTLRLILDILAVANAGRPAFPECSHTPEEGPALRLV